MPDSTENKSSYMLVNAFDDIVRSGVKEWMSKTDMCQCEKCYLDVCAMVFNRHFTHFVTTREGEILANMPGSNFSNQTDLTVAILDSIRKVKSFPRH